MGLKIKQIPAETKGVSKEERCVFCKQTKKTGKSYDEFFDDTEKEELDRIKRHIRPNWRAMLPPKTALYSVAGDTDARRVAWHKKRAKLKKTIGIQGDIQHSQPIGAGGCPFHQPLVELPTDSKEKAKIEALDKRITKIIEGAINRAK